MAYNLSKYTYMLKLCRTADREGSGGTEHTMYIYICVNDLYMIHIIMYYYY